jgi:hypothetical protein
MGCVGASCAHVNTRATPRERTDVGLGNLGGLLVGLVGGVGRALALVAGRKLGQVAVVVALHLLPERSSRCRKAAHEHTLE